MQAGPPLQQEARLIHPACPQVLLLAVLMRLLQNNLQDVLLLQAPLLASSRVVLLLSLPLGSVRLLLLLLLRIALLLLLLLH